MTPLHIEVVSSEISEAQPNNRIEQEQNGNSIIHQIIFMLKTSQPSAKLIFSREHSTPALSPHVVAIHPNQISGTGASDVPILP